MNSVVDRIEIKGKKYQLHFNLNAIEMIQDDYESIDKFFEEIYHTDKFADHMIYLLSIMLMAGGNTVERSAIVKWLSKISFDYRLYINLLYAKIIKTLVPDDELERISKDDYCNRDNNKNVKIDVLYAKTFLSSKCHIDWEQSGKFTYKEYLEVRKNYENIFDEQLYLTAVRKTYSEFRKEEEERRKTKFENDHPTSEAQRKFLTMF